MLVALRRAWTAMARTHPDPPIEELSPGQGEIVVPQEELWRLDALGAAFASSEVRGLLGEWRRGREWFFLMAGLVESDLDLIEDGVQDRTDSLARHRAALEKEREACFAALEAIERRIAHELHSRVVGHPEDT